MHKLEDVYIATKNGKLVVSPKRSGEPEGHYIDPYKNMLLYILEASQVKSQSQAMNELMKISEFANSADDVRFAKEFGDMINPYAKGYKPHEIYRLLITAVKLAGKQGLDIDQWFDSLPTKLLS